MKLTDWRSDVLVEEVACDPLYGNLEDTIAEVYWSADAESPETLSI